MRFLLVSPGLHPDTVGGAWRVAAEQAAGLADRGHSVEVITANPENRLPEAETRDGVRLHRFPQQPGHFYANWRAQNRAAGVLADRLLASSPAPDLVVQHHAFLEPVLAGRPARVLHLFHGPWAEEFRLARRARPRGFLHRQLDSLIARFLHRVEHRALRRADRIITLSRHFSGRLRQLHGPDLAPVEIVPGGCDLRRFQPPSDRAALRRHWGLSPDDYLFLAVRRLDPRMGLELLVEAFAEAARGHPRARLWLTGRGPAETGLRECIDRLQLGDRVRLLGFLPEPDLPGILGAADATLMPSLDLEGFGLATAESLACGTPVLGSRAGATPELLEPLDPALLFEPASRTALADRLAAVLAAPGSLPDRARCAAYARDRFSWNAQVAACERAATELAAPRRPSTPA